MGQGLDIVAFSVPLLVASTKFYGVAGLEAGILGAILATVLYSAIDKTYWDNPVYLFSFTLALTLLAGYNIFLGLGQPSNLVYLIGFAVSITFVPLVLVLKLEKTLFASPLSA
ncbi:hypothetical protein HZC09_00125 [Candidatus Micrarchaeota archaeon]|nr:hypothetical protein [Candidatus Micrarchaeota archaeon]